MPKTTKDDTVNHDPVEATTLTPDKVEPKKKDADFAKYKNLFNYGKRDRWAIPKAIAAAYPEQAFRFFTNNIDRVSNMEGEGWEIANVPKELAEKIKQVRRTEMVYGSLTGDTWVVGGQVLMMRPRDEAEVLKSMKELHYKKLEGKDAKKHKRDIERAVPEYGDKIPVEIDTHKG